MDTMTGCRSLMTVSDDLLFRSRVDAVVEHVEQKVAVCRRVEDLPPGSVVVLDCNRDVAGRIAFIAQLQQDHAPDLVTLAVCSHVDAATRATMKRAGVSVICTNGSMQRVLARELTREEHDAAST